MKLQRNISGKERIVRVTVAIIILFFIDVMGRTASAVFGVIALVLILTAIIGYCPVYKNYKPKTHDHE